MEQNLPLVSPEIQQSLRQRFNPEGSPLRRHQLRMLEMLKSFDEYCTRHDIKYWLSSGTCIGAVRHGGFIPWDDDVDVEMLNSDYRRLRRAIRREPIAGLEWQDSATDRYYSHPFAKLRDHRSVIRESDEIDKLYRLHGIYIDVFSIAPSNSRFLGRLGNAVQNVLVFRPLRMNSALRPIIFPAGKFLAHRVMLPLIRLAASVGAGDRLRHCPGTAFLAPRWRKHLMEMRRVPFENIELPVPADFDGYLTSVFGDYKTLPPVEEITPHVSSVEVL